MTADATCDRQAAIAERRQAYEAEVVNALLDESQEEREERLELVRLAQALVLRAFQLEEEPLGN
jgi:hypothetical protein